MLNQKEILKRIFLRYGVRTQAELGKSLNVSQDLVSAWSTGRSRISLETLSKIVDEKGVTWDWLLTGAPPAYESEGGGMSGEAVDTEEFRFILDLQCALVDVLQSLSTVGRQIAAGRSLRDYGDLPGLIRTLRVASSTGQAAADALEGRPPKTKNRGRTA